MEEFYDFRNFPIKDVEVSICFLCIILLKKYIKDKITNKNIVLVICSGNAKPEGKHLPTYNWTKPS